MPFTVIWELAGHQEVERQTFEGLNVARDEAEGRALAWAGLENSEVTARILDADGNQLDLIARG